MGNIPMGEGIPVGVEPEDAHEEVMIVGVLVEKMFDMVKRIESKLDALTKSLNKKGGGKKAAPDGGKNGSIHR